MNEHETPAPAPEAAEIGMVGLGVMGRNLLLNMADRGFTVTGYDLNPAAGSALETAARDRPKDAAAIHNAKDVESFIRLLRKPRAIIILVPAGDPVDAVITSLLPYLEAGDLLIDGGNSYFKDTERRAAQLAKHKIAFFGMGISGGEAGARYGPSLMPGGKKESYERIRPVLEAIAAKVNGDPCVTYLGTGSAGHFVKMVHNGIEYGLMQLIAESYDLMKRGLGLDNERLNQIYADWNNAELESFLIQITAAIFMQADKDSGKRLIDLIRGEARQKGTGMWTAQEAMELQVPTPVIDVAVAMRNLSKLASQRKQAHQTLSAGEPTQKTSQPAAVNTKTFIASLQNALYSGFIITYAQGFAMLNVASAEYKYGLHLESVARIWRGGCIIRAAVLEKFRSAFAAQPDLPNLLLYPDLAQQVAERAGDLRQVVRTATDWGLPAPGLMAALGYFDAYRSAWLPANLIQAQRDYFGAHKYQRLDRKGMFHTDWESFVE